MGGVESGGGSLALGELIEEHGAFLAADFLSEYGIRLADAVSGWPPREVLALADVLSEGCRWRAHAAGGDDEWREWVGWDSDRWLRANTYNLLASAHHTGKGKAPSYPFTPQAKKKASQGVPLMSMFPRAKKG